MKWPVFDMERYQSTWEHVVEIDLSESGAEPITLRDLKALGLDMERYELAPLGYSQTNGTIELRTLLCEHYPGARIDQVQVTNGTSEANLLICLTLLRRGDEVAFETPNYMQMHGLPTGLGAAVNLFSLRHDRNWEPDWEGLDRAVTPQTRLIYVTNPNNPTGSILSRRSMERIVAVAEKSGAYLVADEVYQGAELDGRITPSFWGMSDRVIVTSGLSKSFGLPGLRIGWLVGPADIVATCWARHDYTSIAPGTLSDIAARTALCNDNRKKLFERAASKLGKNLDCLRSWIADSGSLLDCADPRAGAFAFVRYHHDIASVELAERIRVNRDVLVVPGAYLGMEGYLRISTGVAREKLEEGLRRITAEFKAIRGNS